MSNIYEVLLEKMEGQSYNGYFCVCCPFPHNGRLEEHPSFFVYEQSNNPNYQYRCASCGKHGTLQQLNNFLGSHFSPIKSNTVSRVLPQWKRWQERYGDLEGIVESAHAMLKRYPQFQGYLKKRKMDQFIEQGKFGYLDGWITIPVYDVMGKLVDCVVRGINKDGTRYVVHPEKGKERPLYSPNWKRVMESDVVYVPFGMFDAWAFEAIGYASVTSITGKSINPELLRNLGKRGVIVPDAGEFVEAHNLANSLGWRYKVKELLFPESTKDVDEVRRKYGESNLMELIGA